MCFRCYGNLKFPYSYSTLIKVRIYVFTQLKLSENAIKIVWKRN